MQFFEPTFAMRTPPVLLLVIIYLAFVSLGLPDALLGVAWPAIRADMRQPLAAVGLLTITLTLSAVVSSLFTARVVERLGTGRVVAGSCLMTALALAGMAFAPSFGWLVALVVPLGLGAGVVDASLNHFVATHYAARHMSWLHGFWGVGATLGPAVMGLALARPMGWHGGAMAIGLIQLGLAVVLWSSLSLWRRAPKVADGSQGADASTPTARAPTHPWAIWLAPLCFLFYVAAEIGTGLWASSILVTDRGVALAEAGFWVSLYFGSLTAGRFCVGLVADRLGNRRMVRLGLSVAMAGAALFALPGLPPLLWLAGLMLMGLGCAPVFPSLMHETAKRFPPDMTLKVISRQMMACYAGGSVVPAGFGVLATWAGLGAIMPAVLLCLLGVWFTVRALDRIT